MSSNLLTSCWGPVGWAFLHSVTFGYPENPTDAERDAYGKYFRSLGAILPCDTCRNNYKKNLEELPIERYLGSRRELTYWGYMLHEKVNNELGKKDKITYDEVVKHYESMRSSGCGAVHGVCSDPGSKRRCRVHYIDDVEDFVNTNRKNWPLVLAIVVLIIIIIILLFIRIRPRK